MEHELGSEVQEVPGKQARVPQSILGDPEVLSHQRAVKPASLFARCHHDNDDRWIYYLHSMPGVFVSEGLGIVLALPGEDTMRRPRWLWAVLFTPGEPRAKHTSCVKLVHRLVFCCLFCVISAWSCKGITHLPDAERMMCGSLWEALGRGSRTAGCSEGGRCGGRRVSITQIAMAHSAGHYRWAGSPSGQGPSSPQSWWAYAAGMVQSRSLTQGTHIQVLRSTPPGQSVVPCPVT